MSEREDFKLFHFSRALLEADLEKIERTYSLGFALVDREVKGQDPDYYPQFSDAVRAEAAQMSRHYELFYCLENSIRELVSSRLFAHAGESWWGSCVPDEVKANVERSIKREREAGVTLRSQEMIHYTTFGEIAEIIQFNWNVFGDTFSDKKAVSRILSGLNLLRAPIAHSSPLAADEVVRLDLALKDWFRLME